MPAIPIYSQSPISAAKPDGTTPQTAAAAGQPVDSKQFTPTQTSPSSVPYPAAQPGVSIPGPTAVPSQRYAPALQPTPTTSQPISNGPPPPQPGGVPVLPGSSPPAKSTLPPPPKVGETYQPPAPAPAQAPAVTAAPRYPPPQMGIPPPNVPTTASRGATSTANPTLGARSAHAPVPLGQPQPVGGSSGAGLNHPPGYQQAVNAGEFDAQQRAAQFGNNSSSGYGQGGNQSYGEGEDGEGYWDAAMKFAKTAGDKLSAAETEVWKRINKE